MTRNRKNTNVVLPIYFSLIAVLHEASALPVGAICYTHSDCANPSEFCSWPTCQDPLGRPYPCPACAPCLACACDSDAVDGACPRARCPDQPTSAVRFLHGAFYNRTAAGMPPGFACVRRISFAGALFSEVQASAALRLAVGLSRLHLCSPHAAME
jgi:hypothetical protein